MPVMTAIEPRNKFAMKLNEHPIIALTPRIFKEDEEMCRAAE